MSLTSSEPQAGEQQAPKSVEKVSAIVIALIATAGSVWALMTLPVQAALILVAAAVFAYVGWIAKSYRYPVRSRRAVAAFLCAIAFQFIHMSEEYVGGFPHEIVELFDSPRDWSEKSFLLTFVFGFGAIYLVAAAGALYRIRVTNYVLWFYALGAGLLNALAHFVFPIIKGGYFPGVYTAAGHLIMSALVIYLLLKESKEVRAMAS